VEWWLVPFLIVSIPYGVVIGALFLWLKRDKAGKRRSPLTRDLLRAPGQSLDAKLQSEELDPAPYAFLVAVLPLLLYTFYLSSLVYSHKSISSITAVIYAVAGVGVVVYCVFKLIQIAKTRLKYRLGLEAEMAAGQELNQLLRSGYWVFHDLPAENFNIDHVVVGSNGVFALETKGRAKPGKDVKDAWKVKYDGERLLFPGWTEIKPLAQAERQAKWLRQWLSSAVGENVDVRPILVLPGWFIERTSPKGMPVINAKNPEKLFRSLGKTPLSDKLVQQVVHQLDQRCRDVSARAYAAD
jgi:hypothetical protein